MAAFEGSLCMRSLGNVISPKVDQTVLSLESDQKTVRLCNQNHLGKVAAHCLRLWNSFSSRLSFLQQTW
jgi:hypothetical protein